jgi:hypothetical protein
MQTHVLQVGLLCRSWVGRRRNEIWGFSRDLSACIQELKVLERKSESVNILAAVLLEDVEHCLASSSSQL